LIDRRHGVIRRALTTDTEAHDRARLRQGLIDPDNTAPPRPRHPSATPISTRRFRARSKVVGGHPVDRQGGVA
jgi:hypothetical protein